MKKYGDAVGKVYLYLFSMLGLILVIIGSSGLINLALTSWVFTSSDPWMAQPPVPRFTDNIETIASFEDLSEQDRALLERWLRDYESWEADSQNLHTRHRNNESAARNISLLLVGLPLFLFHWRLVRRQ